MARAARIVAKGQVQQGLIINNFFTRNNLGIDGRRLSSFTFSLTTGSKVSVTPRQGLLKDYIVLCTAKFCRGQMLQLIYCIPDIHKLETKGISQIKNIVTINRHLQIMIRVIRTINIVKQEQQIFKQINSFV